jgi:hypothetical protein
MLRAWQEQDMLERLRGWFRGDGRPAARRPDLDRASGEEAWLTEDEEAREASAPGTPRVKWGGQPR